VTVDPYVDPSNGVLRNRLGITNPLRLMAAEADLSFAALADLGTRTLDGAYDLAHLQAFHREIFGDIYPWAGEIRTVGLARTEVFCLPHHIESYAAEVFADLAKERRLHGYGRPTFVERLTHYLAEINAIHPFRDGNGRAQRAFIRQLARQAGWPIDWSALDRERNDNACRASLRGDLAPLRTLLDELVIR
jgi:cell filamentation protein